MCVLSLVTLHYIHYITLHYKSTRHIRNVLAAKKHESLSSFYAAKTVYISLAKDVLSRYYFDQLVVFY